MASPRPSGDGLHEGGGLRLVGAQGAMRGSDKDQHSLSGGGLESESFGLGCESLKC